MRHEKHIKFDADLTTNTTISFEFFQSLHNNKRLKEIGQTPIFRYTNTAAQAMNA